MTISLWEKKKILIVVKTYPNPSTKYYETVCTAGITSEGKWIRLYPVSYRELNETQQYNKYDWIEVDVRKQIKDNRPESYRLNDNTITIIGNAPADHGWLNRKSYLIPLVNKSLEELNQLKDSQNISLGLFKPREIKSFYWEKRDSKWTPAQEAIQSQDRIFTKKLSKLEKIPYSFHYYFYCNDDNCRGHHLIITDWEIYQAYRSWNIQYPTEVTLEKMKNKWLNEIFSPTRDSYFIVGTTRQYNKFIILGIFWPPKSNNYQPVLKI
jgi:hypothetical protein